MKSSNCFLQIALIIAPLIFSLSCNPTKDSAKVANSKKNKPNIILVMVDDMGWSDLGCYGGEVNTPNIDRLAKGGMRFTQFYNNAKCTTTRASLVTGLYPRRDKKDTELLRTNMVTFGEVLKTAGYQTVLSGKWHLGRDATKHPMYRGFDEYYGLLDGCSNFFNPAQQDPEYKGNRIRYFAHNDQRLEEFSEDFYATDAFTDHAISTIKEYTQNDAPFLLHLTYTAPHYPLHAKPEDIAKYKGKFLKGWDQMRKDRYQKQIEMGLIDPQTYPLSDFDSRAYDWETADHEFEDLRMAVYAAMIDAVDQNIGKLMATLEELKIDDNTLIMFLSDNGGCAEEPGGRNPEERIPGPSNDYVAVGPAWGWAQNAPFRRYKTWMHEGGINTPFIAYWPGVIPADTITREIGHIIDILPTFAEIANATYPKQFNGNEILPVEGKSLLSVLQGDTREGHGEIYWEYAGNRAMRAGNWKIVWDKLTKKWELFDMTNDQTETNDLAAKNSEKTQAMVEKWQGWAELTGVKNRE